MTATPTRRHEREFVIAVREPSYHRVYPRARTKARHHAARPLLATWITMHHVTPPLSWPASHFPIFPPHASSTAFIVFLWRGDVCVRVRAETFIGPRKRDQRPAHERILVQYNHDVTLKLFLSWLRTRWANLSWPDPKRDQLRARCGVKDGLLHDVLLTRDIAISAASRRVAPKAS
jgi:hypothetical protein